MAPAPSAVQKICIGRAHCTTPLGVLIVGGANSSIIADTEDRKMNAKGLLLDMAITITVTFVVAAVVTYLYSVIAHGAGTVNWDTAFHLAIILGIVMPLTRARETASGG